MEGWYVAKVKPQKENSLMNFLSQWGVEVFFPRIIQPGRSGGGMKALFPTYLFCCLDPKSSVWPVVRWAPGMAYFLSHDGEPTCVPPSLVEYLQQRVRQWNQQDLSRRLQPGDRAAVLNGPFAGLEGVFQRYIPSRERCHILLEVVGRLATVELPEWDIKEAAQAHEACLAGVATGSR